MACVPSIASRRSLFSQRLGASALLAGALFLATSCADQAEKVGSAPGTEGGLPIPEQWNNSGHDVKAAADTETGAQVLDAASLAQWWTCFNDPVLDELIHKALDGSPSIRTALARIEESRARRGVTLSGLLPTLSGSVTGRGSETRNHNLHQTTSSENYTASLDARWEIDLFGKQRLALDAATADLEQSQENLYAAQVSLAAEVAEAYVQMRAAQSQLDVLRRNIAARAQTTELTQWRAQAGNTSTMEAEQALSTLNQAKAAIPSSELTIGQTRNRLALLCGLAPGTLDKLLGDVAPVPSAPVQIVVGIPAETLRQRPDIRAAEQGFKASILRIGSAERELLPSLNLSGSIGIEALKAGNLFSPDATVASILGSLVAPIFQGGRIVQTIAISEAQGKQALVAYELAVLTALTEVENSLIAVRQSTDRLEILRSATASAMLAATLAAQRYEAGEADLLTVLEAQRTQLSLEEQEVNTTASLTSAYIQLYKSLGGGWSPRSEDEEDGSAETVAAAAPASEPEQAPTPAAASTTSF